jgi:assimilatory nitrate reductase catalytic subunit
MQKIRSTCPYCGVGCGVTASENNGVTTVVGDALHPANVGSLCSKGSSLGETLLDSLKRDRITSPSINGDDVTWECALQTTADSINLSIQEHGRDSVAFYLSGQLLTEDYYVANKLMKGYIGTANVDTNSRLCMSSAVGAYKRAFGSDVVPCAYEDIDAADLIVLIGSNAAWTHPVLYQRMVAAKEANSNLKVVLIDPRATATCDIADLHLAIKPSSDGYLFQGLLAFLISNNALNTDYITKHTDGFEQAKAQASEFTIPVTSSSVGIEEKALQKFYELYANTDKVISFYSQGINQSATGTDKCNAIINCHLATGRIGYEGAGPFSITGQPNAMGGREVGGLANQLAAHMDFDSEDRDRVQRFWQSPLIAQKAGLKAVDLFDQLALGRIKVIWIMATNPAVSMPNSEKIRKALDECPTVIVSDVTHTDTSRYANILLPALSWSEKDGTVTNSERCISRQRAFKAPTGESKADWWIVSNVAQRMGINDAFDFGNTHQIFNEHARLSGFENNGSRGFDISDLSGLSLKGYNELKPIQWPVNQANPEGSKRLFENGLFFTHNQRAKFVSNTPVLAECVRAQRSPHEYILNTGRIRDQWHTMTRTGDVPSLSAHDDLPFAQINTIDAARHYLKENQMVRLSNNFGEFIAVVKIDSDVKQGELFAPIHWNNEFAKNAVVTAIVSPEVDPVSGQPEFKASAVTITKYECKQWARIASLNPIDKKGFDYWAQTKTKRGYITLLGINDVVGWRQWCETQLGEESRYIQYSDDANSTDTVLVTKGEAIEMLVYALVNVECLPSFSWLASAFDNNDTTKLTALLHAELGQHDQLICSCFGTTKKSIEAASLDGGVKTLDELGATLGCGSKCGSCKPELAKFING